jgi:hypothetical protein
MTNMLEAMMVSSFSFVLSSTSERSVSELKSSASFARNTAPMDSRQNTRGLIQSRSRSLFKTKVIRSLIVSNPQAVSDEHRQTLALAQQERLTKRAAPSYL